MTETRTLVLIPARMAATRLPGKPLLDIAGLPMIVHVLRRAEQAGIGRVAVATDSAEIAAAVRAQGGEVVMTRDDHPSGSDRIFEALTTLDPEGRIDTVINLQGDLPTIDPLAIQRCLAGLTNETVDIATIAARIESDAEVQNPNVVKVIAPLGEGREVAYIRDFVRNTGPEHDAPFWRHINVYAYRREALDRFASLPVSTREAIRKLEQLRALDNDMRMAVVRVDSVPLSVGVPADLEAARAILRKKP